MYKEYLIRYPSHSVSLVVQMIETASMPDVKLHKKTVTLITLYQCINSQMVNISTFFPVHLANSCDCFAL
jgi:hypothetical protein